MKNNKLEKDYLYSDGYYRQKSVKEAVKIVDELLVDMINDWNRIRRDTSLRQDDEMHLVIDALRDCLYYLTNNDEYNNDIDVRQKLHLECLEQEEYYGKPYDPNDKLSKKLYREKLKIRRAGRVIIDEPLYGIWAFKHL